jgi:hexosaminidase
MSTTSTSWGSLAVIPAPRSTRLSGEWISLPARLHCFVDDAVLEPLLPLLNVEYGRLTRGQVVGEQERRKAHLRLVVDPRLADEAYRLEIGEVVSVTGGSYRAVAMGSVTLLQALQRQGEGTILAAGQVEDYPLASYRGLVVDVARQWHDIALLEQLVQLCRWYKINYLQLHLTDDESFTFPSTAYPCLPTPGRHYRREQLRALDEYARVRGVALVPELEMPGHAGQFVRRLPELFGVAGAAEQNTLNMGREEVYHALNRIIGEMATLFPTAPYFHIGGDEAQLGHLAGDPDVQHYLATHQIETLSGLYRHFIVRTSQMVRKHGKQPIVWEGFYKEGEGEIPRDIIVMAWETLYQLPQDLLAAGYPVINVSWKPLYVVNERKWPVETIYQKWNLYRWENWLQSAPSYHPIQLEPTSQVLGASLASWDQPPAQELPSLRRRLAALSERTWNASLQPRYPTAAFLQVLDRQDRALQQVLEPDYSAGTRPG